MIEKAKGVVLLITLIELNSIPKLEIRGGVTCVTLMQRARRGVMISSYYW